MSGAPAHGVATVDPPRASVSRPLADLRAAPDAASELVDQAHLDEPLTLLGESGTWLYVQGEDLYFGWIERAAVRPIEPPAGQGPPRRYPTPADLIATAEAFLGVPYLWGGTSAHGIDCSGLTQRVYRLNGVGLDRDADQQALGGRAVDIARPGDLFFFGAESVTHTAIATGPLTFIHAPQAGLAVQRGELSADRSRLRALRRYLP